MSDRPPDDRDDDREDEPPRPRHLSASRGGRARRDDALRAAPPPEDRPTEAPADESEWERVGEAADWDAEAGWDEADDAWDATDDADYVELPPESSRRRRVLTLLGAVVGVLALAIGGVGFWASRQLDPPGPPGAVRTIEIAEGSTSDDIGAQLADEGVIASALAWDWYLRIKGGGPFQAGIYELAENSAVADVIDVLAAGPKPPEERSVTVPEGLTLTETLARLADPELGLGLDVATMQQLLDSGQVRSTAQPGDQPSNEGILFPETYRVAADADELAVLTMMVRQLDSTLAELDVASAQERYNLTPYDVLIVASLIEEETKVDEERPKVAQVIYNRLRQDIALGIDATSRYEAVLAGRDREDVDFSSDSPYNTRRQLGLPPTPIASPGRASIEAALNPAEGPWIYYVLEDAAGHHFFTESNSEFLAAKARCRDAGLGCG